MGLYIDDLSLDDTSTVLYHRFWDPLLTWYKEPQGCREQGNQEHVLSV